ncbi:MAG: hypothetical protein GC171_09625 [Terrimonas sp.]|nr:hypothetical protein [Terrimonas sp.]
MRKIIAFVLLALLTQIAYSQMPDKFVKAMESKVAMLDSIQTAEGWIDMANAFERIANAEKTQWLPYYYAAFSNVMAGYMMGSGNAMGGDPEKTDPLADKAEKLLNAAEAMEKDNSEIFVVKKMIASLRMMADPMNRYMTYGPVAATALARAKALSPDNPRVYILEAQDKFYTPEQFGGSKTEAKELFLKAYKEFEIFKPASPIHPDWGRSQVNYFLTQF